MNYHIFREIADSWVLLLMVLFFLGTVLWAWRPGSRRIHEDTADIPFRHDTKPACDKSSDSNVCDGPDAISKEAF